MGTIVNILIITGIIAAAVLAAGAYLRWAVRPVVFAFKSGQRLASVTDQRARRVLIHALADVLMELEEHHGAHYRKPLLDRKSGEWADDHV